MAFIATNLQVIGGQARSAKAARVWAYTTTDTEATVNGAGYFGDQRFAMRIGDLIVRTTVDGAGAHVETGLHVITTKTASLVTCITAVLAVSTGTGMPTTGGVFTGLVGFTVDDAVACAGSTISDATALTAQWNRLASCSANEGAGLPNASTGVEIGVLNDTANDARIYPHAAGAAIGGLGAGVAQILPAGLLMKFRRTGVSQWRAY